MLDSCIKAVFCLLLLGGATAADPPARTVGSLGDPQKLTFAGLETFPETQVRSALATHLDVQYAAHEDAELPGYLNAVREAMEFGYRRAGFAHVKVDVTFDAAVDEILVQVDEGERFRAGNVKVTGTRTIPVDELVRWLTTPHDPHRRYEETKKEKRVSDGDSKTDRELIWESGKPVDFTEDLQALLLAGVREGLAGMGYLFPKLSVRPVSEPGKSTAYLSVHVDDEGPKAILGKITIEGNKRNSTKSILEYLDVDAGISVDRQLLAALEDRLRDSARFCAFKVTPKRPAESSKTVDLHLKLVEYDQAPLLTESFSREEEAFLKCFEYLNNLSENGQDLVVEFSLAAVVPEIQDLQAKLIFSARGEVFANVKGRFHKPFEYTVLWDKRAVEIYAFGSGRRFEGKPGGYAFQNNPLLLTPSLSRDLGEWQSSLSFGISFKSSDREHELRPFESIIQTTPVCALLSAHRFRNDESFDEEGGILTAKGEHAVYRIDAKSGRLLQLSVPDNTGTTIATAGTERGAYIRASVISRRRAGEFEHRVDDNQLGSFVMFLIDEVLWHYGKSVSLSADVLSVARKHFVKRLESNRTPRDRGERFQPTSLRAGDHKQLISQVLLLLANSFDRGSWPWRVARESSFLMMQKGDFIQRELALIYNSPNVGPIGCLTTANLLTAFGDANPVRLFAYKGLRCLSAPDFHNDVRLLFAGDRGAAQLAARMVDLVRELDEGDAEQLASLMPSAERKFFMECWRALRRDRKKPTMQILQPILDEYWQRELRSRVERALKALSEYKVIRNV